MSSVLDKATDFFNDDLSTDGKNNTLNRVSFWLAKYINNGEVSYSDAYSHMFSLGVSVGHSADSCEATIKSAFGAQKNAGNSFIKQAAAPIELPSEVNSMLWDASSPKFTGETEEWLILRGYDVDLLESLGIVRQTTYGDIVVRGIDENYNVLGCHMRRINGSPKTKWLKGTPAKGLYFAFNTIARKDKVLIVEGITDFMSAACFAKKQDMEWSVFGIVNGSVNKEVTRGFNYIEWWEADYYIGTDNDIPGDNYCKKIVELLDGNKIYRINYE